MGSSSQLNANAAGGDILFNNFRAGAITVTGGPSDGAMSANDLVDFNGGATGTVNVNVLSIDAACITGNGDTFTLTTNQATDLNVGPITTTAAGGGAIQITNNGGNVNVKADVTADGALTITSDDDAGDSVTIAAGVTASGSDADANDPGIRINAPTVNLNGTITADDGNVEIQSNDATSGNALNVVAGAAGQLNANAADDDILFNPNNAGAVTINNGNGALSAADIVNFNVGTNALDVDVSTIAGCITVTGTTTSAAIIVNSGLLDVGPVASTGAITLESTTGSVNLKDTVNAGGSLTLTSGPDAADSVTVAAGVTASGSDADAGDPGVRINTPSLVLNGTVAATDGNVEIQSNDTVNNNALILTTGAAGQINANSANDDLLFNPDTAGSITATGGNGAFSADDVIDFNGDANGIVNINVVSLAAACVAGTGDSFTLVVNQASTLNAGPISTTVAGGGGISLTNNGGSVNLKDTITADGALSITTDDDGSQDTLTVAAGTTATGGTGVTLTTPGLNLNGTVNATTGNINVQSNDNVNNNALLVTPGVSGAMNANDTDADIFFNRITAGSITMNNGNGTLSADDIVDFNGGANGPVNVDILSIDAACVTGNGDSFTLTANQATDLSVGPITTTVIRRWCNTDH